MYALTFAGLRRPISDKPPREAGRGSREAAVRRQTDGFEGHRDNVSDMLLAVEGECPALVGAAVMTAIERARIPIRREISVGEFVVLGFGNPPETHPQPPPNPDLLALEAARQVPVEEPVVTDLVGRYVAADLHEHRFPHPVAQRRVVRAGPDLDHTARNHLSRTRAAARHFAIEIDAKALMTPLFPYAEPGSIHGGGELGYVL